MALTDIALRNAKATEKPYKLTDEKGLYLLVTPSGGRLWKLKFRNKAGVEKKLSLGTYPEDSGRMGQHEARRCRHDHATFAWKRLRASKR